jgi:hypothetical protein
MVRSILHLLHQKLDNYTYWELKDMCKYALPVAKYNEGFGTLPSSAFAHRVRGACCTEEVAFEERGFADVIP